MLLVALIAVAAPAGAQQPTELPPIVIQGVALERPRVSRQSADTTAPAQPAPAAGPTASAAPAGGVGSDGDGLVAGIPAREVGTAVTVVTRVELERQQIRHAADALRSLPGVSVSRQGGPGHLTQVRLRGAEANHTLVLIDGIVANDTGNGEVDFSLIPAEDIERIEVIRGPMSGLYGSNAIGGVINIVTRRGAGPLNASIRSEIGSFGTKDVAARVGAGNDRAHIALSGQWRETSGFNIAPTGSERDGSRLQSFALTAGGRIGETGTLDINLRRIARSADLDGFGGSTVGSVATAFDDASTQSNTQMIAGGVLKWDSFGRALSHEVFLNHNAVDQLFFDGTFLSNSRNASLADTLGYRTTLRLDAPAFALKNTFSTLVQKDWERFTPSGDFDDGVERRRGRVAFAGEWRGGFADTLFVTAGVRHDNNDTFQDFTTWRLAASFNVPGSAWRPHASVGTGVKLPTMFEQFGSNSAFFAPNPKLKPEASLGWDAGLEVKLLGGRALLDVTFFRADLTNEIRTNYAVFPSTPVNIAGESLRQGVEVSLRANVAAGVSLGAAYTYTDTQDASGTPEVRRAPHTAKLDASTDFAGGRGKATLAATYNGRMTDFRFVNVSDGFGGTFPSLDGRAALSSYWLVTAAASYRLAPNVEVYARVENALNQKYQEVFGYATAGIAAYAGVKLTFEDIAGTGKPAR